MDLKTIIDLLKDFTTFAKSLSAVFQDTPKAIQNLTKIDLDATRAAFKINK